MHKMLNFLYILRYYKCPSKKYKNIFENLKNNLKIKKKSSKNLKCKKIIKWFNLITNSIINWRYNRIYGKIKNLKNKKFLSYIIKI
jgi:hypothetical protein